MKPRNKDFNDTEFANRYSKNHTKLLQKLGLAYAKKLARQHFVKGRILDAGCGSGEMMVTISRYLPACEITGIDISDPLLEYANQLKIINHLNNRVQFIKGNVKKMPFENNSFDVVFSVNMVHFVDDPIRMLNEMERILKPGGYLFIKDLRYSWLKIFEDEIGNSFKLKEAEELIKRSNLRKGYYSKSLLWWNFEVIPSSQYQDRS